MTIERARRARRRQTSGGAVMLEAVIVIVVLIIIDVSLLYMYDTYAAKLGTMRLARQGAWSEALVGCTGGGAGMRAQVAGAGNDPSLAPASAHLTKARSIARGRTLTKPLETELPITSAHTSATIMGHTYIYREYGGGQTSTRTRVLCNELQDDISQGDIRMTIDGLYRDML